MAEAERGDYVGEIIKKLTEEPTTMLSLLSLLVQAEILKHTEETHIKAGESAKACGERLMALTREWSAETKTLCLSTINNSCLQSKLMTRQTGEQEDIQVCTGQCDLDGEVFDSRSQMNVRPVQQIMQEDIKDTTLLPKKKSTSKRMLVKKDSKIKDIGAVLGALANIGINIPEEMNKTQKSDDFLTKAENVQHTQDQSAVTKSSSNSRSDDSKSKNIESVGAIASISFGITEENFELKYNDESRECNVTKHKPLVKKDSKSKLTKKNSKSKLVESVLEATANFSISVVEGSRSKQEIEEKPMVDSKVQMN